MKELTATEEIRQDKAKLESDILELVEDFKRYRDVEIYYIGISNTCINS